MKPPLGLFKLDPDQSPGALRPFPQTCFQSLNTLLTLVLYAETDKNKCSFMPWSLEVSNKHLMSSPVAAERAALPVQERI